MSWIETVKKGAAGVVVAGLLIGCQNGYIPPSAQIRAAEAALSEQLRVSRERQFWNRVHEIENRERITQRRR